MPTSLEGLLDRALMSERDRFYPDSRKNTALSVCATGSKSTSHCHIGCMDFLLKKAVVFVPSFIHARTDVGIHM